MWAFWLTPGAMLGLVAIIPAAAVRAQDTPVKSDAAAKIEVPRESATDAAPQEAASAEALSLHYRFIERYSPTEDPKHPELLTQYRVGLIETQKTEREKQQVAPLSASRFLTKRSTRNGRPKRPNWES